MWKSFDNMGEALKVRLGKSSLPDLTAPAITVGFPNILRLLATYDLRATFFVEGWSALHYGDVVEFDLARRSPHRFARVDS